jgi:hypothetical protein
MLHCQPAFRLNVQSWRMNRTRPYMPWWPFLLVFVGTSAAISFALWLIMGR